MAALLLIQPLLDVLSYFMQGAGATVITTGLRLLMLLAVCAYAFSISSKKHIHLTFYGIIAGFWVLHAINAWRIGYADPVGDAAEYLKLVQFPLWTLAFITFFHKREDLNQRVIGILAANFGIILLVIGLSFLAGKPVYTYDYPERDMQIGILGWFGVANAQSAIVAILISPLLLWALGKKKLLIFSASCLAGFGLLYFTGTRLTYYSAILAAAVFLGIILIERRQFLFCLPLLAVLVLLVACRGISPMAERQSRTAGSYAIFQEKADNIMGEDKDFVYREGQEFPEEIREKVRRVYEDVYGQPGLYGVPLLGDLIDRFGVEAVMEQYSYATNPETLYNSRTKKLTALRMVWQEQDFLTRLVGFEYSKATLGGNNYDAENDIPALLYYNGYLGAGMYLLFAAYFVLAALLALLRNLGDYRDFITGELVAAAMMFALALGSAQFSGQVLRKPNVTVYFSVAAALLYCYIYPPEAAPRLYRNYDRKSVVVMKKI